MIFWSERVKSGTVEGTGFFRNTHKWPPRYCAAHLWQRPCVLVANTLKGNIGPRAAGKFFHPSNRVAFLGVQTNSGWISVSCTGALNGLKPQQKRAHSD